MYICFICIFVFLLTLTGTCQADYFDMALEELSLVKGASLFLEKRQEAPWPSNVLTSEHLRRFGWLSIDDILEYQPSFYLVQDVNERVIAHRGVYRTSTQHLLFLEDDFRLNLPLFESFTLDYAFPLVGISKIEIIRGPGSSLYGNSGLTGVVSVSRSKSEKMFSGALGSFDMQLFSLDLTDKGVKIWSRYFNRQGEKVFVPASEDYAQVPANGFQYINPTPDNYALGAKWERENLLFYFSYFHSRYNTPRGMEGQLLLPQDHPDDSFQEFDLTLWGIKYLFDFWGFKGEILPELAIFWMETPQVRQTEREGGLESIDISIYSKRFSLTNRFRKKIGPHQLLWGVDLELQHYDSLKNSFVENGTITTYDISPAEEFNWAVYFQAKLKPTSRLITHLGLRWDDYESFGGHLSPRLGMGVIISPSLTFNITFGEAFQAPPYFYREANPILGYGSTTDLKAEESEVYSAYLEYKPHKAYFLRVTGFRQTLKNLFQMDKSLGVFVNLGEYTVQGIELEGEYFSENLIFFSNYSWQKAIDAHATGEMIIGHQVLGIPKWAWKGGMSLKLSKDPEMFISPCFRWYGETLTEERTLPSYILWDIYFLINWRNKYDFFLKVENLFDENYYRSGTVPPYPQEGRTILGGMKINF